MRLGLNLGYWGAAPQDDVPLAREAESLGYHSIWTAEAWGSDAITPLTWLAARTERIGIGTAIMQMPARTPANTAMTAMTLDHLTGGRFMLGLGVSGPQVVEGWHGVPYGKPVKRAREYISIVRAILRRERRLEFHGEYYDIPTTSGSGLGIPLKIMTHPLRRDLPIYLGAMGPKNVALAAEIADGWLPMFFSPDRMDIYRPSLDEGFSRGGKDASALDIAPTVHVRIGDDTWKCRNSVKPVLAFYIGAMGARGRNFYFDLACRYGYESAAVRIQDNYQDGKRAAATVAVPDALVDEVALCGPRERVKERLEAWKSAGVGTLICAGADVESLRAMAELVL